MKGLIALVTGAASGIGRATALELMRHGATVIVNDLTLEGAQKTVELLEGEGGSALALAGNVAVRSEVEALFGEIEKRFGRLDILVNNAGLTSDHLLSGMTDDAWDRVMDVNLRSVFLCSQAAIKLMEPNRCGRIVNLSSLTGQRGNVGQVNYAAAKGGIIAVTKTLALELARHGITVNAVAPGLITTPMTQSIPERIRSMMLQQIPLGRAGEPEEVAKAIRFLASDDASYITGQILGVNGGGYL